MYMKMLISICFYIHIIRMKRKKIGNINCGQKSLWNFLWNTLWLTNELTHFDATWNTILSLKQTEISNVLWKIIDDNPLLSWYHVFFSFKHFNNTYLSCYYT